MYIKLEVETIEEIVSRKFKFICKSFYSFSFGLN